MYFDNEFIFITMQFHHTDCTIDDRIDPNVYYCEGIVCILVSTGSLVLSCTPTRSNKLKQCCKRRATSDGLSKSMQQTATTIELNSKANQNGYVCMCDKNSKTNV